jgi:heme A synthase
MVLFLVYIAVVMLGTAQYGTGIATSVIPFTVAAVFSLLGLLIYYAFKAYRRAHGVDLALIFRQIPPE